MNNSDDLRQYGVPYVEHMVRESATSVDSLDDPSLALINHLAMYFGKDLRGTLRSTMRERKRLYDASEPEHKTPYALRNITDPLERGAILSSISAFSTTQGCSGGCTKCGYDALLTNDIEVMPLGQKLHFYDELVATIASVDPRLVPVIIEQTMQYHDSNSFDDPDVVAIAKHVYDISGAVPRLSNNSSTVGIGNFMHLAEISEKYRLLESLLELISYLCRVFALSKATNSRTSDRYNRTLDALGLNPVEYYLGLGAEACINQLRSAYDDMYSSLNGAPNAQLMRLSVVSHRPDISADFPASVDITHKYGSRSKLPMVEGGKDFYESGAVSGELGISCKSGMILTPFGLFSSAPGLKTHEYPQGRIFAPYRGLDTGSRLLLPGTNLESALDRLVVINRPTSRRCRPSALYVFDGDRRIREVAYDPATYTVLNDTIICEDSRSPANIISMRAGHAF